MHTWITIFCLTALFLCSNTQQPSNAKHITVTKRLTPVVTIEGGTIAGIIDTSGIAIFRGIPYAAPPFGKLRWQPPQPIRKWKGIRRATQYGPSCPQPSNEWGPTSEDCLYLNVYTNKRALEKDSKPTRPVMVWIHGGGFFSGSARGYNGQVLAQKDAVIVTLNYRLGPFGYLDHPALEAESPHSSAGNYGLLDQIAALTWVQHNIAQFGGSPSNVTIFGESAGGFSVGALLASPSAKGLFHRAILQSGNGLYNGILPRDIARNFAISRSKELGIPGNDAAAAKALRSLTAEQLLTAYAPPQRPPLQGFVIWFAPVVDGWALPMPLDQAIDKGKWNHVPVLIGSNRDEGPLFQPDKPASTLEEYYRLLGPADLGDTTGELARTYAVSDTASILARAQELVGDLGFGAPAHALARLVSAKGGKAFLYYFTRTSKDRNGNPVKAMHTTEISFVFGQLPLHWEPFKALNGTTPNDAVLADAMSDYWVAFAKHGDPNGPPAANKWPYWPIYNLSSDAYLEISTKILSKTSLKRKQYEVLDRLARQKGEVRY